MDTVMLEYGPQQAERRPDTGYRQAAAGAPRRLEEVIEWLRRSIAGPDWNQGACA